MLKPGKTEQRKEILDGTGIIISKSRRGRERGQLEIDEWQYDSFRDIFMFQEQPQFLENSFRVS